MKTIISELPECSALRQTLTVHTGAGVEQPYMQTMRKAGVERVSYELRGSWKEGHPASLAVVRRLFFRQFDNATSQIVQPDALRSLKDNGLEAMLDDVVRQKLQSAVLYAGIDSWAGISGRLDYWIWRLHGAKIWADVELFSSPWISKPGNAIVSPSAGDFNDALWHVAEKGDSVGVRAMLAQHHYTEPELNYALAVAVQSFWDNRVVIELLLNAGANVNATVGEHSTPLTLTWSACNIPPLLAHGASLNEKNDSGKTALELARERKDSFAIRILEEAAAHPQ